MSNYRYLDLEGLTKYDQLLKTWLSENYSGTKLEMIFPQSNQESYTIEPNKRYIIHRIGENVATTNIILPAFEDWEYTKSYEIDFITGENVGEIRIWHENNTIVWVKDLEILPNTRYLISIDETIPDDILTAMYVTIVY